MTEKKRSESFFRKRFSKNYFIREKASLLIYLIISLSFLIQLPEDVNAQARQACCEKTKSGDFCVYTDRSNCDNNFKTNNARCDLTNFCSNVCCVSSEGSCSPNTPSSICTSQNGGIFSDASCSSVSECRLGCCIIAGEYQYTSETSCRSLANSVYGNDNNFNDLFRNADSEQECLSLSLQEQEGCCVNDNSCSFGKKSECTGEFKLGKQCNQINKCNQLCKTRDHKNCYQDGIYWFDGCGNREDLVEQCYYDESEICAKENNNVFCKSLNCETTKFDYLDYTGKYRKHGESWCVFESPVGNFKDRPGSRHYRYSCINGKEVINDCGDFRTQVCVQANYNNGKFSQANCVNNNVYSSPVNSNISTVQVGFKFWGNSQKSIDQCNKGTIRCPVYWVKKDRVHDYECRRNCVCETQEFLDQANDYCRSFGDCGINYNIADELGSGGLDIYWTGRTDHGASPTELSSSHLEDLKKYGIFGGLKFLNSEAEKVIEALRPDTNKDLRKDVLTYGLVSLAVIGIASTLLLGGGLNALYTLPGILNVITGGLATSVGAIGSAAPNLAASLSTFQGQTQVSIPFGGSIEVAAPLNSGVSTSGTIGSGAGTAVEPGGLSTPITGLQGGTQVTFSGPATVINTGSTPISVASTPAGQTGAATTSVGAGQSQVTGAAQPAAAGGSVLGVVFAIIVILIYLTILTLSIIYSGGHVRQKTLNLECKPWQPPFGGDNCGKCNEGNIDCTEYRCRSLGLTCRLVNENSPSPKCVDVSPNDISSPKLKPLLGEGYNADEQQLGFRVKELVEPMTKFTFGVTTDEEATCNYDLKHSVKYENMQYPFGDSLFKKEHSISLVLEGDKDYRFYVRCVDANGNDNSNDYAISFKTKKGQDLQAPIILGTSIKKNAYLPHFLDQALLDLELNEPSNCRYDFKDKRYDDMTNFTICNDEISLVPIPYKCTAVFTGIKPGINTYFFRCKDLAGNPNSQSEIFSLIRSEPLKISVDDISPKGLVLVRDVSLAVTTSEGSERGKSICRYSQTNVNFDNIQNEFKDTNSNKHLQVQNNLNSGDYNYYIKCRDGAGNEANTTVKFNILRGAGVSRIINIFKDSSNLNVIVSTDSVCEYNDKDFVFGTGKKMDGDNTPVHKAPLEFNQYYIKCKDNVQNDIEGIRVEI